MNNNIRKFPISKEQFVKIINKLEKHDDYMVKLYDEFGIDFDKIPYVDDELVELLDALTNDEKWVGYYCYELDFGKEYEAGMVTMDEVLIDISTPEKLYNMLENDWDREQKENQVWNEWKVQLP